MVMYLINNPDGILEVPWTLVWNISFISGAFPKPSMRHRN